MAVSVLTTMFLMACYLTAPAVISSQYLRLGETECASVQHRLLEKDSSQVNTSNDTATNQTLTDNKTKKPEIVRSRRYLRDTCRDIPLSPFRNVNPVEAHARLCPVVRVCTKSENRFPSYIIHYTCRQRIGFIGKMTFQCLNETREIDVLKRLSCDGEEPSERLEWKHEKVTVGCTPRFLYSSDVPERASGSATRKR